MKLRFMMESPSRSGVLYIANMYSILALDLSRLDEKGAVSAGVLAEGEGAKGGAAAAAAAATTASEQAGSSAKTGSTAEQLQKTTLLGEKAKPLNCVHCGVWNVKKSSYCGGCK
jgi:hypothetical protein